MKGTPRLPIPQLERETENLSVYDSLESVRLVVEEFWDCLDEEFDFWDADGFRLKFAESFLKGADEVELVTPNETSEVKALLKKHFARGMGKAHKEPVEAELTALYKEV